MEAFKKLAMKWASSPTARGYLQLAEEQWGSKWGSPEFQQTLRDAFDRIEVSGMRLKLSSIHAEPEYAEILKVCMQELSELTSVDLSRDYRDPIATVFITSPGGITPYHVDHDANFLIQLHGGKTVHIFDGNDHELLPWNELEEYWHGSRHLGLREEFESRGMPYELSPGTGLHHPVNFPHWVQNGPLPSISLAVSFTRVKHDPLYVLRLNRYLRSWGIEPTPPGKNAAVDTAKRALIHTARSVKKALRHSA